MRLKSRVGSLVHRLLHPCFEAIFLVWASMVRPAGRQLVFCPTPIISNRYWVEALREGGENAVTLMSDHYSVNRKEDFDLYYSDLVPGWVPSRFRADVGPLFASLYLLREASVVHIPFTGGPLGPTRLWRWESKLLKRAGIKIVVLPYGGDAYMYSQVIDTSLRHGLLLSYPAAARREPDIHQRVESWNLDADAVICGFMVDGMARWDVPAPAPFCIDLQSWKPDPHRRRHGDGTNGMVTIVHTPNHRGFKGTEFIVDAVDQLRREGLLVELRLLEQVPNEQVRTVFQEIDILVDQLIATAYAFSAIEGMASGLPVLANLENDAYTRLFRRWSYLQECPVVSTSPETVVRNLRLLITRPDLRDVLGRAGRAYAEKYHSYEAARFLFGCLHEKILGRSSVDLMNIFHPLLGEYGSRLPRVEHPLQDSRLPEDLFQSVGSRL